MRCNSCRYWEEEIDRMEWTQETFEEVVASRAGKCLCPSFIYRSSLFSVPVDGVIYWDSDTYAAGLLTGPEFGCIHWTQREE